MVHRRSSYVFQGTRTMVCCSINVSSDGGHQIWTTPMGLSTSRVLMSIRAPWTGSCYLHVHASVVVVVTARRKMDGFVCQRLVQGE